MFTVDYKRLSTDYSSILAGMLQKKTMTTIFGYRNLNVYKKAFQLLIQINKLIKRFPADEKDSLTDQVRRSSRSVAANIVEAYKKRVYPKDFARVLRISDSEASETVFWLEAACACEYITPEELTRYENEYVEVGKMLGRMIENPEKFKPFPSARTAEIKRNSI